jgi:DNA-binding response OmpR family regulator
MVEFELANWKESARKRCPAPEAFVVAGRLTGSVSCVFDPQTTSVAPWCDSCIGAAVRVLLLGNEMRDLPFANEALATFAEPVIKSNTETESASVLTASSAELLVITRNVWSERDTALCGRLYGERLGIPVLCVCGASASGDRAQALRAGADDFLGIPFELEELVARAFALVRRASSGPRHARAGEFLVDFGRRQIFIDGQAIALTLHEYDVLATLIDRAGEVVTRQELAARTSSTAARESNIVDVHVSRIREKLGARAALSETVRRIGYRLRPS